MHTRVRPMRLQFLKTRPLSPDVIGLDGKSRHYNFPWAALSSITNRVTGVALSVGECMRPSEWHSSSKQRYSKRSVQWLSEGQGGSPGLAQQGVQLASFAVGILSRQQTTAVQAQEPWKPGCEVQ